MLRTWQRVRFRNTFPELVPEPVDVPLGRFRGLHVLVPQLIRHVPGDESLDFAHRCPFTL